MRKDFVEGEAELSGSEEVEIFPICYVKKLKLGWKNKNLEKAKRASSFPRKFRVHIEYKAKLLELGQYMLTHVDCRMR